MLVLVSEQIHFHAVAADNCELGGVGVTVGQVKAKGVLIEGDAFLDVASRNQRRDIRKFVVADFILAPG